MAEIKKISTELQLLDKFLDTSGSAGSSGSVLTSTTTGTSWVSAGTPGTGIYLPLAGGRMTTTAKIEFYNASQYIHALSFNDLDVVAGDDINYRSNFSRFFSGTTEHCRVSGLSNQNNWIANGPGGKLGVNITAPLDTLHVDGGVVIQNGNNLQWGALYSNGGPTMYGSSNYLVLAPTGVTGNPSRILYLDATGLGVGKSSPNTKLDVAGTARFSDSSTTFGIEIALPGGGPLITFGNTSDYDAFGSIGHQGSQYQFVTQARPFNFINGSTSQMFIASTGKVGIGTTLPASKLEVSGRISGGELGSSDVCRNGLLFYVDFNDKACVSGTSATEAPIDLGPQNLQMSLVGGANFEYKDGIGCYYFDGSNDHILISDYVVADTVNSYEIWHYAVAQNTYETWWDSGNERPLLGTYDDNLIAYPAYSTTSLGDKINTGKWYHVVWAMNGNTDMDIFVNGKRTHEGLGGNMQQRTGTFNAQLGGDGGAETTNGFIAITRTYSRQLTPEDVLQNYNAEVERFAPVTPSLGIVQSYGNVGIGTTTPSSFNSRGRNLVVNSDGDTGITISANTTSSSTLLFADSFAGTGGTTAYRGSIEYDHANDSMALSTSATERMRITSAGNVGIGNTSPNEKLQITGNIRLDGSVFFSNSSVFNKILLNGTDMEIWSGALFPSIDIASNGLLKFGAYALSGAGTPTKLLGVDSSGNVLTTVSGGDLPGGPYLPLAGGTIGTGQSIYFSSTTGLRLVHDGSNGNVINGTGDLQISNGATDKDIIFKVKDGASNVEVMRIDGSTSNVGIGTTSPGNLLDVAGDTDISGQLFVQHSGSYTAKLKQLATSMSNATYTFEIDSAAHTSNLSTAGAMSVDVDSGRAFTINGLGNVGIGTDSPTNDGSTANTLEVRGKSGTGGGVVRVSNAGNTASARFFAGSASGTIATVTNHDLNISTNNSLKMVVKAGGNVGINVTNPSEKLHVAGNIFVTGKFGNLVASTSGVQFEAATAATQTCRFDSDEMRFFAGGGAGEVFTMLNSTGATTFTNTVTATNFILSSDERLKENIKTLKPKTISAEWKSFNAKNDDSYRTGVIAQDLEIKHPEFVETNDKGFKSVKYIDLLISKIAELEHRIKQLEK